MSSQILSVRCYDCRGWQKSGAILIGRQGVVFPRAL
jgi:hypothetical protein